jgi:hypothetical protein
MPRFRAPRQLKNCRSGELLTYLHTTENRRTSTVCQKLLATQGYAGPKAVLPVIIQGGRHSYQHAAGQSGQSSTYFISST